MPISNEEKTRTSYKGGKSKTVWPIWHTRKINGKKKQVAMLFLISDENFNNDTVRGLLRRKPDLDIVRVQDVGLWGTEDPVIIVNSRK